MRVRIRFAKTGAMRFVGHLDITRFFQKAFRRTGLPLAYSGGYSPHILLTFASPLSIGMTSEGEYMDLVLSEDVPCSEVLCCLREQLSEGLETTDIVQLREEAKTPMAILRAASYRIRPRACDPAFFESLGRMTEAFLASESLPMLKKSKKGERTVDIRPLIYDLREEEDALDLTTAAGSVEHLKPELALEALVKMTADAGGLKEALIPSVDPLSFTFHRLDLLGVDPRIVKPGEPLGEHPLSSLILLDNAVEA